MTPDTHAAALLTRFTDLCRQDVRLLAGFVCGSYARGTTDAYSDVDLGLITTDAAFEDFAANKADFIRRLGQPLLLEDFDRPDSIHFILPGGLEGELHFAPQSAFSKVYPGGFKVLVDKTGVLDGAVFSGGLASAEEQRENLRRQVYWFWHDLSHFITAIARRQHWWAMGQLELLRRTCLCLALMQHDFTAKLDLSDPYFKLEKYLPIEQAAPLRLTFCPLDADAMLQAAQAILAYYRALAPELAAAHGIDYPGELDALLDERLAQITM
jgi:predicted nucleotidyltransferase